jgi:hypothetical protein
MVRIYLPVWASLIFALLMAISVPRVANPEFSSWVNLHDEAPNVLVDAFLLRGVGSLNSPLARGSRATTARGRDPLELRSWPSTTAAAWASCMASSAVNRPFASPRTPSVPNNLDTGQV